MENDYKVGTRVIRQLIISVGFLPGLWLYLGVDPEAEVDYAVINVIAEFISSIASVSQSEISLAARISYEITGYITAIFSWIFVYLVSGGWGVLATIIAFTGGLFVNSFGIWLFAGAFVIAPFLPVKEEY